MLNRVSILFIIVIIITLALIVAYRAYYERRINKELNLGKVYGRRFLSPLNFAIIIIGAVLVLFNIVSSIIAANDPNKIDDVYVSAYYDFNAYNKDDMTGYRSTFSIDENNGYTKDIKEVGDTRYTCFIRNDEYDQFHPSFIIFVEYIGNKNILYYGFAGEFMTLKDQGISGKGGAGSDYNNYFCILGNASVSCRFSLTTYFYDSMNKGEDINESAVSTQSINIEVP